MSFDDYIGKCTYDPIKNIYEFEMQNEIIEESNYIEIADPTIDNTFKNIFLGQKKITLSCLNSLLFPDEDRINDIKFLPSESPGEGPYSRGSIRFDLLCKCYLTITEDKEQHYNNDSELIVDFEIEKGFKNTNDERFIKYARTLSGKYTDQKILILLDKSPWSSSSVIISIGSYFFSSRIFWFCSFKILFSFVSSSISSLYVFISFKRAC